MIFTVLILFGCNENVQPESIKNDEIKETLTEIAEVEAIVEEEQTTNSIDAEEDETNGINEYQRVKITADKLLLRNRPVIDPFSEGILYENSVVEWVDMVLDEKENEWYKVLVDGVEYLVAGWYCELTEEPKHSEYEIFDTQIITIKEFNQWSTDFFKFEDALYKHENDQLMEAIASIRLDNEMVYTGISREATHQDYEIGDIFFLVPIDGAYNVFSKKDDQFIAYGIPFDDIWSLRDVKLINGIFVEPEVPVIEEAKVNEYHPIVFNSIYIGGSIDGEFFNRESIVPQVYDSGFIQLAELKRNDLVQVTNHGYYVGEGVLEQPKMSYIRYFGDRLCTNSIVNDEKAGLISLSVSADWDASPKYPEKQVDGTYELDINGDGIKERIQLKVEGYDAFWEFVQNDSLTTLPILTYRDELHSVGGDYEGYLSALQNNYFIDLNGDGCLEYVALTVQFNLKESIQIYDFSSGTVNLIFDVNEEQHSKAGGMTDTVFHNMYEDDVFKLNEYMKWSRVYEYFEEYVNMVTTPEERLLAVTCYQGENSGEYTYDDFKYTNPYSNRNYTFVFDVEKNTILWNGPYGLNSSSDFSREVSVNPIYLMRQNNVEEIVKSLKYVPILINNTYLGGIEAGEFFDFNDLELTINNHYNASFEEFIGGEIAHQYYGGQYVKDIMLLPPENSTDYAINYYSEVDLPEHETVFSIGTVDILTPVIPVQIDATHFQIDINGDGIEEILEVVLDEDYFFYDTYHLILKNDDFNIDLLLPSLRYDKYSEIGPVLTWNEYGKHAMFVDINKDGYLEYLVNSELTSDFDSIEYERQVYDLSSNISKLVMRCRRFDYN